MKQTIDLSDLGLSETHMREAAAWSEGLHLARVAAQHRDGYTVMTGNGENRATVSGRLNHLSSDPAEYPVVGDWVLVDRADGADGNAVIHRVLTRKSSIERGAAGGTRRQVLAANINTLFLCMSLNDDFNLRRIERYLAIAWDSGATPVIVLTKADLCGDVPEKVTQVQAAAPGVDVVVTCALEENGYEGLKTYMQKGRTAVFLGSSGVGKSSLINGLLGAKVQVTKGIRENDGKGRHTTTRRQLLRVPGGGAVIDTPGLREIRIACSDLSKAFSDIEELARGCRFRDCKHMAEPDCAVQRAVEDGRLFAGRLENYHKLQRELKHIERSETMTAGQAEKRKSIDMMGSLDARKQLKKIIREKKETR